MKNILRESKKTLLLTLLLGVTLLTAACGQGPAAKPAEKADVNPAKVKVGTIRAISDAPIFIALEKGYFKEQNLDVEAVSFGSGADMIAPLSAGQLDAGAGTPSAGLYNAIARGFDLQIVADKGRVGKNSDYIAILVRKDLSESGAIKTYADLKGKKIAVSNLGGSNAVELGAALQKAGLTLKDVEPVEMSFPNMGIALANKSIDAAVVAEPNLIKFVEAGYAVRWKGVYELVPDQQAAVLLYAAKFAKDSPDVATRFMVAYLKGIRDYNDAFFNNKGYDEVVAILTKHTSVKDAAVYKKMAPAGFDSDGKVNLASLQSDYNWYKSQGKIQGSVDFDKIVNPAFAKAAAAKIGK
ncbi:MAG TPA: ABC transporter substrate-binding protein [Negativicutes bacterium]|nr:ABC transporter substrate-binding protein [Negativicutes bacterium]